MIRDVISLVPVEIQYKSYKFLITNQPKNHNIKSYIRELKKYNVAAVVRVCEPSYPIQDLQREGIPVYDLTYNDGSVPPGDVVNGWFSLLKQHSMENPGAYVAVHCVAGLGRAPVLVAVALMELGLKFEDTVELIREKKRGAINSKQLDYLGKYRPNSRLKLKNNTGCCIS